MTADAMLAPPRPASAGRLLIVLEPVSHPELQPIHIHENLFAIGRTEAPFDAYPAGLAADLSRRHARIFCEHGAVYFAELGSKNGSTVNGVPVKQAITTLHSGDVLGIGKALTYRVHLEHAASQPPHARLASLSLSPEGGGAGLQPIVVSEFPFMVSKADDSFARYKDSEPAQVNYLSRRHAHIFLKNGAAWLEDLGSTNGSFVNGVRLDEHAVALHEGDLLAFGGRYFVYRLGLQWDASARDPTLTRIGAVGGAPAPAEPDADKTTFVAAANSFLDIFCVDPARDDTPDAALGDGDGQNPQDKGEGPPQGRSAAMLSGLYAALGGRGTLAVRRMRQWGLAALALLVLLVLAWPRFGGAEGEVEDLLARGAYAQAAVTAADALADDPDNSRLRALGTEALLKARLPAWIAALEARQFGRAASEVAAMRQYTRHNPELAPLLDQLDWMVALERFAASRGGAQAASRDAQDAATIAGFLQQWEERDDAYQRGFETMSAHVPAFRDTYANALSDVRKLALARSSQ
ncbi:FHA domain-containing protein [Massilia sp. LjRoot122]|uniref:FHA domain-containing protein n=1 Tax=Massilia sp. LjRoot122 TaxID=3342257 RepID=UPI003ECE1C6D